MTLQAAVYGGETSPTENRYRSFHPAGFSTLLRHHGSRVLFNGELGHPNEDVNSDNKNGRYEISLTL